MCRLFTVSVLDLGLSVMCLKEGVIVGECYVCFVTVSYASRNENT